MSYVKSKCFNRIIPGLCDSVAPHPNYPNTVESFNITSKEHLWLTGRQTGLVWASSSLLKLHHVSHRCPADRWTTALTPWPCDTDKRRPSFLASFKANAIQQLQTNSKWRRPASQRHLCLHRLGQFEHQLIIQGKHLDDSSIVALWNGLFKVDCIHCCLGCSEAEDGASLQVQAQASSAEMMKHDREALPAVVAGNGRGMYNLMLLTYGYLIWYHI